MPNGREPTRWGIPQVEVDMVSFQPHPWDERIERRSLVFYVRAVPGGMALDIDERPGTPSMPHDLAAVLILLPVRFGVRLRGRRRDRVTWRVGVVRTSAAHSWAHHRATVVHEQHIPRALDPRQHLADLIARVHAGDFEIEPVR